jgi:hypothetical protein
MEPAGRFAMRRGPRAAEVLLHVGLVKEDDLQRARRVQQERGGSLVLQLVRAGAPEGEVVAALGRELRLPTVNLRGKRIDPDVLALVPREVAERYGCLPLFVKDEGGSRVLYLGVEDPSDDAVADDVSFHVGLRVRPVVVGALQLRAALRGVVGPGTPEPAEAPAPLRETPVPATDTAPLLAEAPGAADDATLEASDATPALAAEKPRDVPTRDILRAVTWLLIEKEVFTRAELFEAVRTLRAAEGDERA